MKKLKMFKVLSFIAIVLSFNVVLSQNLKKDIHLKFEDEVETDLSLIDSIYKDVQAKIKIILNYSIENQQEKITVNFHFEEKQDFYVFLFDQGGDLINPATPLRTKFLNVNKKILNKSIGFMELVKNKPKGSFDVQRFYNFKKNQNITLQKPFISGASFFQKEAKEPLGFIFNNSEQFPKFEMELLLYHGEAITRKGEINEYILNGSFKKLHLSLHLPDLSAFCSSKANEYAVEVKNYPQLSDFSDRFNQHKQSWKTDHLGKFSTEIDQAIAQIEDIALSLERLNKEALIIKCNELKQIKNTLETYLQQNNKNSFDALRDQVMLKLGDEICEIEYQKFKNQINKVKSKETIQNLESKFKSNSKLANKHAAVQLQNSIRLHLKSIDDLEKIRADIDKSIRQKCPENANKLIELMGSLDKGNLEQYQQTLKGIISQGQKCEEFIQSQHEYIKALKKEFIDESYDSRLNDIDMQLKKLQSSTDNTKVRNDEEIGLYKRQLDHLNMAVGEIDQSIRNLKSQFEATERNVESRSDCNTNEIRTTLKIEIRNLEDYQNRIDALKNLISETLREIDDSIKNILIVLNQDFNPFLEEISQQYSGQMDQINNLEMKYKSSRLSGRYYKWKKSNLLKNLNKYNAKTEKLSDTYQQLLSKANQQASDQLKLSALFLDEQNRALANKISEDATSINFRSKELYADIYRYPTDKFPYFTYLLIIIGIAILTFGARVYFLAIKNRKINPLKKGTKQQKSVSSNESATIDDDILQPNLKRTVGGVTITKAVPRGDQKKLYRPGEGLQHIEGKAGREYYEIDLNEIWDDSSVKKLYIHRDCIKKTYRFYYESCITEGRVLETGGYLIGAWEYDSKSGQYDVSLEDFIEPGDDAIYGEYQLNFGAKIGIKLEKTIQMIREKSNRNYTLTAWFHSHPEIKIFLSNHDLDVQEQLSSKENKLLLLALVIDPVTQHDGKIAFETGIFSYKKNGAMNNNNGDMALIKWSDLYEWARKPMPADLSNHFELKLHEIFQNTLIDRLYWSNKSITRFALFLDDLHANQDAFGFFSGYVFDHETTKPKLVFEDFISVEKDIIPNDQKFVGLFIQTNNIDQAINNLALNNKLKISDKHILIFCDNKGQELYMVTKKDMQQFNRQEDALKPVSLAEIEAWPTRRR